MASSSFLRELNSKGLLKTPLKPKIKPEELTVNEVYKVVNFKRISGAYGPCILVEIADGIIFMPKRYSSLIPDEKVSELNQQQLGLVLRGFKSTPNGSTPLYEIVNL